MLSRLKKRDVKTLEIELVQTKELAYEISGSIGDALMDVAVALDSIRGWPYNYVKRVAKSGSSSFGKADINAIEVTFALSS